MRTSERMKRGRGVWGAGRAIAHACVGLMVGRATEDAMDLNVQLLRLRFHELFQRTL